MTTRGVPINKLIEDIKEELNISTNYLFVEVDNSLLVFLHLEFLTYCGGEENLIFLEKELDTRWGMDSVTLRTTYAHVNLDKYTFPNWRFLIVRAHEWDKLALRDTIERYILRVLRNEPIIYTNE